MRRDELFEALAEVCGWNYRDVTRTARGRLNSALVELREVEATPELIRAAARVYRALYVDAVLTPQALTGNWPDLMQHVRDGLQRRQYDPAESFEAAQAKALPEGEEWATEVPDDEATQANLKRLADMKAGLMKDLDADEEEDGQPEDAAEQG